MFALGYLSGIRTKHLMPNSAIAFQFPVALEAASSSLAYLVWRLDLHHTQRAHLANWVKTASASALEGLFHMISIMCSNLPQRCLKRFDGRGCSKQSLRRYIPGRGVRQCRGMFVLLKHCQVACWRKATVRVHSVTGSVRGVVMMGQSGEMLSCRECWSLQLVTFVDNPKQWAHVFRCRVLWAPVNTGSQCLVSGSGTLLPGIAVCVCE